MKKSIIITGKSRVGKTRVAKALASQYENVVSLDGKNSSSNWLFHEITKETKVVFIDDVSIGSTEFIQDLLCFSQIKVEKRGQNPFYHAVKFIITFDEEIKKTMLGSHVLRRVDHIHISSLTVKKDSL